MLFNSFIYIWLLEFLSANYAKLKMSGLYVEGVCSQETKLDGPNKWAYLADIKVCFNTIYSVGKTKNTNFARFKMVDCAEVSY